MVKIILQSILFVFGFGNNPIPKQPEKTDREWLEQDWQAVGNDLRNAMVAYGEK